MLTREENDLLTRTNRGTPGGEWMRRYWLPALLSEELPSGGPPVPLMLLGEELVAFRDADGRVGLLGLHCAHRGADLSYGRLEDGGLRCLYHGWLYDVAGRCLEQPGEPAGSTFCERVRQPAYPTEERGGVIFAYLGPGEPPLFPNYEFLNAPAGHRFVTKYYQDCNYLQGSEGNIDPVHNNLLHHPNHNLEHVPNGRIQGFRGGRGPVPGQQELDCAETEFGLALCDVTHLDDGQDNLRSYCFVLPAFTIFPGQLGRRGGYSLNWHVPIDDHRHWKYAFAYCGPTPIDVAAFQREAAREIGPDYHLPRNRANRYLQDRSLLATASFSGIAGFAAQDSFAIEGLGPIADRTREHLGQSDRIIIAMRRLLLRAVRDVAEGRDPPHVIRDPVRNHFPDLLVWVGTVPRGSDWQAIRRDAAAHDRGEANVR